MRHEAIRKAYPAVVTILGDNEAYDVNGKKVIIDDAKVVIEVAKLQAARNATAYQSKRAAEYPPMADYLDAVVKGDAVAQQAYIDACLAVKVKYPKP